MSETLNAAKLPSLKEKIDKTGEQELKAAKSAKGVEEGRKATLKGKDTAKNEKNKKGK